MCQVQHNKSIFRLFPCQYKSAGKLNKYGWVSTFVLLLPGVWRCVHVFFGSRKSQISLLMGFSWSRSRFIQGFKHFRPIAASHRKKSKPYNHICWDRGTHLKILGPVLWLSHWSWAMVGDGATGNWQGPEHHEGYGFTNKINPWVMGGDLSHGSSWHPRGFMGP